MVSSSAAAAMVVVAGQAFCCRWQAAAAAKRMVRCSVRVPFDPFMVVAEGFGRGLHGGPDDLEELLDRTVVSGGRRPSGSEEEGLRRLTSSRREGLSLYREILRATRVFVWRNERGVLWRDVLRESARREFEEARHETDPEVIARLLVGGRDAMQAVIDKAVAKQRESLKKGPFGGV